jgi:hypothetical protein
MNVGSSVFSVLSNKHKVLGRDWEVELSAQASHKCRLLHAVSFFYATYLTFPEHIHPFISLQSSPCCLKRKEAHPELDEPFDARDDLARRGG